MMTNKPDLREELDQLIGAVAAEPLSDIQQESIQAKLHALLACWKDVTYQDKPAEYLYAVKGLSDTYRDFLDQYPVLSTMISQTQNEMGGVLMSSNDLIKTNLETLLSSSDEPNIKMAIILMVSMGILGKVDVDTISHNIKNIASIPLSVVDHVGYKTIKDIVNQTPNAIIIYRWFCRRFLKLHIQSYSTMSQDDIVMIADMMPNIQELNLSGNRLRELPPEIGNLTSLTHLNLSGNRLRELPPEISNLTSLTHLNLSGNILRELPPEIGNLKSLMHLNISGHGLRELPPEIGNLTSLTHLNLSDTELRELPPGMDQLQQLQELYIDRVFLGSQNTPAWLQDFQEKYIVQTRYRVRFR